MSKESRDQGLIAHWPFLDDHEDHIGSGLVVRNKGVVLGATGPQGRPGAAAFNGKDAFIEIEHHPILNLGTGDFTIAGWMHTHAGKGDVIGNIISKFDPDTRRGMQLYILTNTGVTATAQPNYRHLHFGIDSAHLDPEWTDWGHPGNAVKISAMLASRGVLYAATLETGAHEMGHLWR